jgi:hypothetical protein
MGGLMSTDFGKRIIAAFSVVRFAICSYQKVKNVRRRNDRKPSTLEDTSEENLIRRSYTLVQEEQ